MSTSASTTIVQPTSCALCLTNERPSSTRQITLSARPTAPNAPEAP